METNKIIKFEGEFKLFVKPRGYIMKGCHKIHRYLLIDSDDLDIKFEICKNIKISGHHPFVFIKHVKDQEILHIAANNLKNGLPVNIGIRISKFERNEEPLVERNAVYFANLISSEFEVKTTFLANEELDKIDISYHPFNDEPDMSIVPEKWLSVNELKIKEDVEGIA